MPRARRDATGNTVARATSPDEFPFGATRADTTPAATQAVVLSLDLASSDWSAIGIAVLRDDGSRCEVDLLTPPARGRPTAAAVGAFAADVAHSCGTSLILIDGSQAWNSTSAPEPHRRRCEAAFNTPSKTGLPGLVKPRTYTAFTLFSIEVFNTLHALGFPRLATRRLTDESRPNDSNTVARTSYRGYAVEAFPYAAWRGIGATPLPSKQRCRQENIDAGVEYLVRNFRVRLSRAPSHDELQATVAGLGGLALVRGSPDVRIEGEPPFVEHGEWREGFILVPQLATANRPTPSRDRRQIEHL